MKFSLTPPIFLLLAVIISSVNANSCLQCPAFFGAGAVKRAYWTFGPYCVYADSIGGADRVIKFDRVFGIAFGINIDAAILLEDVTSNLNAANGPVIVCDSDVCDLSLNVLTTCGCLTKCPIGQERVSTGSSTSCPCTGACDLRLYDFSNTCGCQAKCGLGETRGSDCLCTCDLTVNERTASCGCQPLCGDPSRTRRNEATCQCESYCPTLSKFIDDTCAEIAKASKFVEPFAPLCGGIKSIPTKLQQIAKQVDNYRKLTAGTLTSSDIRSQAVLAITQILADVSGVVLVGVAGQAFFPVVGQVCAVLDAIGLVDGLCTITARLRCTIPVGSRRRSIMAFDTIPQSTSASDSLHFGLSRRQATRENLCSDLLLDLPEAVCEAPVISCDIGTLEEAIEFGGFDMQSYFDFHTQCDQAQAALEDGQVYTDALCELRNGLLAFESYCDGAAFDDLGPLPSQRARRVARKNVKAPWS